MSSMPFRLSSAALVAGTLAFALLASGQASAGDPVYKWKDANGHSQYSQQPPPKGVKFEIVEIAGGTDAASGTADANAKGHPMNVAPKTTASAKGDSAVNPDKPSQF